MKSVDPGIHAQSVCFSFTPSEQARELYFYPTWCGHYFCSQNYFIRRETYPPILIAYVRKGQFHVEYRDQAFDAGKGDVVLLDCMEPHYYQAYDGLEFLYMNFDGSNSHKICQNILEKTGPLIKQESNAQIGLLLYDTIKFHMNGGIEHMIQSSMRIYRMFEYLLTPDSEPEESDTPIDRTIRYIRANYGEELTLNDLANVANLSSYYYAHSFKERTGYSPIEFLTNTRLEQAKILLARTTRSVAEIAYEVGYSSGTSLINMFIKKTGITPKQYRRANQSPQT